jgi:hypothetical protein
MRAVNRFQGRSTARPNAVGDVATPPAGKTTTVFPSGLEVEGLGFPCRREVDRQREGPDLGRTQEIVVDEHLVGAAKSFDEGERAEAVEDAVGMIGDDDQGRVIVEFRRERAGCDVDVDVDEAQGRPDDGTAPRHDLAAPVLVVRHEIVAA